MEGKTMMNMNIMMDLVNAFDNGEPTIGDFIIEKWHHTKGTLKLRRASANFIFYYQNNQQDFVLRLTPNSERTKLQILAELDFMQYLLNNNFPVPEIISSQDGNLIEEYNTDGRTYLGVAFQKCPGVHYEINELPETLTVIWGQLVARFHELSQTYKPKSTRKRKTWADDVMNILNWLPENDFQIKELLLNQAEEINSYPKDEHYGLIHYDLELDNILWNGNNYYVIDFDDATYYHYIADIACAIDESRFEKPEIREMIQRNFLTGYQRIRDLPPNWQEQFDCFCILMDIMDYARTLHAYKNTDPSTYPEWVTKLHSRHMKVIAETKTKLIRKLEKTN
jgi:Ser/Thr protein kinase RdoA (MazF antagonist)